MKKVEYTISGIVNVIGHADCLSCCFSPLSSRVVFCRQAAFIDERGKEGEGERVSSMHVKMHLAK